MNSAAYSTNCTVFDPKGKILQVRPSIKRA